MTRRPTVERLLGPAQPELGCDECFDYLDSYVERELLSTGEFEPCPTCVTPSECAHTTRCEGMRAHLEGCAACAEEHASLRALMEAPDGPSLDGPLSPG